MTLTLLIIVMAALLIITAALLFIPWSGTHSVSRDVLNRAFYHSRLRELERENTAEREEMVAELQHNLLDDIPAHQGDAAPKPLSRWVLAPGVAALLMISLGVFWKTVNLKNVLEWQEVTRQTPELLNRVMDPNAPALTMEEMARLGLGLRTRLQDDPNNVDGWMMLGRIGMALNNATTATDAFEHAWKLAPNNIDAKLDYAEVLIRSSDENDNKLGDKLLREAVSASHTNIRALSLLAFSSFEQQRFGDAIAAWQMMLGVLPQNDKRRAIIERSIAQAQAQTGMDNVPLAVKITLSPEAQQGMPANGTVFITVVGEASPVPVAVKKLPVGQFPMTLNIDDSNTMMPGSSLSSLHQGWIKVHISQDGTPAVQSGDWVGQSALIKFDQAKPTEVIISSRQP
ncbi:c-type cytochrome biogenesis protein CcmI [Atlantibacter sp.]|uniref:c-type cytochrome biogenesis protein CcmI n=1 Tax=Atlantibacter sp. TaxID=1903473 RepID=UPI00289996CF|nr:c-type cytochrome biogenesis protein CcmI [Atlantibacter sp.]